MNLKNKSLTVLLVFTVIVLNIGVLSTHANFPSIPSAIGWIDNFDNLPLDNRWSWIREDPTHWSLSDKPGYLRIITQPGGISGTNQEEKNILLTNAPYGNYQITTQVTIEPTENFQGAAIFVYQDDDNYLRVSRRYGNGQMVMFRREVGGIFENVFVDVTATTVFLRLYKEGDAYQGSYSLDGFTWNILGEYNQSMIDPKIGIGSENGPTLSEIPSDYNFFQLEDYTNYLYLPTIQKN